MSEAQQELRIASFRRAGGALFFSALLLVVVSGAVGYFLTNLPEPFEDWMLLASAGVVVLAGVIVPWWIWASRSYLITTRRVIAQRGIIIRRRRELLHGTGYSVELLRGPSQRMFGTGTLRLSWAGTAIEMRGIRNPKLVRETLSDQIEICQILAHRQAQQLAADPYLDRPEQQS